MTLFIEQLLPAQLRKMTTNQYFKPPTNIYEEISDYIDYIKPFPQHLELRHALMTRLLHRLHKFDAELQLELTGSTQLNLNLPQSDVDLLICRGGLAKLPPSPDEPPPPPRQLVDMVRVYHELQHDAEFQDAHLVPLQNGLKVLQLHDSVLDVRVDIVTGQVERGGSRSDTHKCLRRLLSAHAGLAELILFVKQMLRCGGHNMCEVFHGGMRSYAVVVLCACFMRDHWRCNESGEKTAENVAENAGSLTRTQIGRLVIDFLRFVTEILVGADRIFALNGPLDFVDEDYDHKAGSRANSSCFRVYDPTTFNNNLMDRTHWDDVIKPHLHLLLYQLSEVLPHTQRYRQNRPFFSQSPVYVNHADEQLRQRWDALIHDEPVPLRMPTCMYNTRAHHHRQIRPQNLPIRPSRQQQHLQQAVMMNRPFLPPSPSSLVVSSSGFDFNLTGQIPPEMEMNMQNEAEEETEAHKQRQLNDSNYVSNCSSQVSLNFSDQLLQDDALLQEEQLEEPLEDQLALPKTFQQAPQQVAQQTNAPEDPGMSNVKLKISESSSIPRRRLSNSCFLINVEREMLREFEIQNTTDSRQKLNHEDSHQQQSDHQQQNNHHHQQQQQQTHHHQQQQQQNNNYYYHYHQQQQHQHKQHAIQYCYSPQSQKQYYTIFQQSQKNVYYAQPRPYIPRLNRY